jgi:hypothetical protein
MKKTMNFQDFKDGILKNIEAKKEFDAEHLQVFKAKNFQKLCEVIKQNFLMFCRNKFITGKLLEAVGNEELNQWGVAVNKSINFGYLYAFKDDFFEAHGVSFVYSCGKAIVNVYDRAVVVAFDHSEIFSYDSSKVFAYGKTFVATQGSSIVHAFDHSDIAAYDNSIVFAFNNSKIKNTNINSVLAFGNAKVIRR